MLYLDHTSSLAQFFPTEPALHWVNNQANNQPTVGAECGSWHCASWRCALIPKLGTSPAPPWPHELLLQAAGKSFESKEQRKPALQQLEAWWAAMVPRLIVSLGRRGPWTGVSWIAGASCVP